MPESPNKLLNNDHGNYIFATFTGHIYDTTLDIYFAEARFYDANNRTWLAMDPIKDGLNWYQYCYSNPTTYWELLGLEGGAITGGGLSASATAAERAKVRAGQSKFNQMSCQAQKNSGIGATIILEKKMVELLISVGITEQNKKDMSKISSMLEKFGIDSEDFRIGVF